MREGAFGNMLTTHSAVQKATTQHTSASWAAAPDAARRSAPRRGNLSRTNNEYFIIVKGAVSLKRFP